MSYILWFSLKITFDLSPLLKHSYAQVVYIIHTVRASPIIIIPSNTHSPVTIYPLET